MATVNWLYEVNMVAPSKKEGEPDVVVFSGQVSAPNEDVARVLATLKGVEEGTLTADAAQLAALRTNVRFIV